MGTEHHPWPSLRLEQGFHCSQLSLLELGCAQRVLRVTKVPAQAGHRAAPLAFPGFGAGLPLQPLELCPESSSTSVPCSTEDITDPTKAPAWAGHWHPALLWGRGSISATWAVPRELLHITALWLVWYQDQPLLVLAEVLKK